MTKTASTLPAPDTFGHENIRHPFSEYTLAKAVALARNIASISGESVTSLVEARAIVDRTNRKGGHNWITGSVALDLFDAAIDGFNITIGTRMIGSDTRPKARELALQEFVSAVLSLENKAVMAKEKSGVKPTLPSPHSTMFSGAMMTDCFDKGLAPEDAHRMLSSVVENGPAMIGRPARSRKF